MRAQRTPAEPPPITNRSKSMLAIPLLPGPPMCDLGNGGARVAEVRPPSQPTVRGPPLRHQSLGGEQYLRSRVIGGDLRSRPRFGAAELGGLDFAGRTGA